MVGMVEGARKLRRHLKQKGLSLTEFARIAGVPIPQVSMWRAGKRRPGLASALKVERATEGEIPASAWTVEARRRAPLNHKQPSKSAA